MEALTRWVDSDRGIMSPNIFIPVLERAHLVHKLDAYVLNEVGSILSQSIKEGYLMIPVSINLSHSDFVFSDPFHELETVVKKYKLHRDFFCIEITESVLMSRKYDAVGFLNILTEKPAAIFLSRGDEVRILLANPAYKKVLESIGGREEKEPNPFTAWVEMNF